MTTTTTFTPRLTGFGVAIRHPKTQAGATFTYENATYAFALKKATEWRARGVRADVVAHMTRIGSIDVDGALLYDGSTWIDTGDYLVPAVVNGITYRETLA